MKKVFLLGIVLLLSMFCHSLSAQKFAAQPDARDQDRKSDIAKVATAGVAARACGEVGGAVGSALGAYTGPLAPVAVPVAKVVVGGAAAATCGYLVNEYWPSQPNCTTITATINGEVVGQRSSCGSGNGSGANGGGGPTVVKTNASRVHKW